MHNNSKQIIMNQSYIFLYKISNETREIVVIYTLIISKSNIENIVKVVRLENICNVIKIYNFKTILFFSKH